MSSVKIEFRCTEDEKKKVYEMAGRMGMGVKDFMLNSTIYKKGRSSLGTREKAAFQRMKTSLNKIGSGIDAEQETQKIIGEVRTLCWSLKL